MIKGVWFAPKTRESMQFVRLLESAMYICTINVVLVSASQSPLNLEEVSVYRRCKSHEISSN